MFEHIEAMIPNGRFWIYEVLMMISIIYLIACGVSRLRSSFGKKWLAISICIFGYLFCVVISTANHFASDQLNSLAFSLSNPVDLAPITKDWGTNFTIEKRTEYSQALARNTF